jgi:hypothetical protein
MAQVERRKEAWISIQEPDGKNMIASPSYILNLLKIPSDIESRLNDKANWKSEAMLRSRINVLENALEPLLKDYLRKKRADALLNFKPNNVAFHRFDLTTYLESILPLEEMVYRGILYDLFEEDLAAGRIIDRTRGWFSIVPIEKKSEGKTK